MLVIETAAQKFHPRSRILLFFHSTTCDFCPQLSYGYKMARTPPGIASKFQGGSRGGGEMQGKDFSQILADFHLSLVVQNWALWSPQL